MDADGRIIPMVEDDQGEGIKDPLTVDDLIEAGFYERAQEITKEFERDLLGDIVQNSVFDKTASKVPKDLSKTVRWAPEKRFDRNR